MRTITAIFVWCLVSMPAFAAGIDALSDEEAVEGLKQALTQSVNAAVDRLGVANGFLENPKVKISLPSALQKVEGVMRTLGASKHADGLIVTMNRVAEVTAADARALMVDAVEKMPVENAKKILASGGDAATQYFRTATSEELAQEFPAIVKNATSQVDLAKKYNDFVRKGGKFGVVAEKYANIEGYVAQKTLDGIYLMMAEEEAIIRQDPMGQDSKVLQKVFGSLK
ncbi:DUF4197 domain-containing protein [Nitrosospira sp. NpAV]|uniref:DUF4197 domain-containing protein n=1 Tax=Nitrosospira sp. NpAV TaxID=58133 RepID=UPI0005A1C9AE|nr:DUF4197 domain-containing protein [Nitrosospira sp. NpAV]KIO49903.1 hypothetical protein SQ11_03035 [Nitrosospira sp. NpAV]